MKYPGDRQYLQACEQEILEGFDETLTADDFTEPQKWMTNLMASNRAVYLGAYMGSGKTAAALRAFHMLWEDHHRSITLLVIAPLYVTLDTWPTELLKWDFARDLTYSVIAGDPDNRSAALKRKADVYVINRENYAWLVDKIGNGHWPFNILVYDEASRLKGGNKRTSKNAEGRTRLSGFGYLAKTAPLFEARWLLSGSPATEGLIDLWGPVYVLDRGERLGRSLTAFRDRWFKYDPYKHRYTPFGHAQDEIMERLRGVFWVLKEEDYRDSLLTLSDRFVRLDREHMRLYRRFERTLVLEGYDIEAVNNGVLAGKLLQFANGSVYDNLDEDDPEAHMRSRPEAKKVHERKLQDLESIIEEAAGDPLLIAYSYKFDVHAIKKRFSWIRVYGQTGSDLKDWNAGRIRAMVMHPASAGHGLNFQGGGHLACWYGLTHSLELTQQFNKRLDRLGQKADFVRTYRILARNTLDEDVAENLERKGVTQEGIIDAVRVRIEDIRAGCV